ncbi:MAG: hypothetical protein ACK4SX_11400 [Alcanivoracaceae bacterium]
MRHHVWIAAGIIFALPVVAQEKADSTSLSTNIIGSQEAPTVLNVVPWKDKEVQLEKKDPTSSLLNRVLEPLDQDVLMREVEYYRILGQESGGDGLFMD